MNTIQAYDSLSPITTKNKKDLVALAIEQANEIIEAGSAEQAWAFLSKIEVLIKAVKENIKESVIVEIEKQNNFAFGVKMMARSKGTPSYKSDPTWVLINAELKKHEAFLKTLDKPTTILNEETGQLITYYPPVITHSDFVENEF